MVWSAGACCVSGPASLAILALPAAFWKAATALSASCMLCASPLSRSTPMLSCTLQPASITLACKDASLSCASKPLHLPYQNSNLCSHNPVPVPVSKMPAPAHRQPRCSRGLINSCMEAALLSYRGRYRIVLDLDMLYIVARSAGAEASVCTLQRMSIACQI